MINGGYTIWARQSVESNIFFYKPAIWFKIWFFLVVQANHYDTNLFKRGEVFSTYDEIMRATKASKTQVHDCIHYLERDNMITSRKTTRGMVRYIVNYDRFQDPKSYKTTTRQQARQLRDNSEAVPIHNNVNTKEITTEIQESLLPTEKKEKTYQTKSGGVLTLEQVGNMINKAFLDSKLPSHKDVDPFREHLKYWLERYSLEELEMAIAAISMKHRSGPDAGKNIWWASKPNPVLVFRTKGRDQQPVDYIGELLHIYKTNYDRSNSSNQ